jgi:hypothetical protein
VTRLVCVAAALGLLLGGQPATPRVPTIQWQATNPPLGGEADSIFAHAGQLVVPLHNVGAWRSRDRGKSWQLVTERQESWGMTVAGPDLFVFTRQGLRRGREPGGPWVTCGAIPRPRGGSARVIDGGKTLFFFVGDLGLFRSRDRCASWAPVAIPWQGTVSSIDVVFSRGAMIVSSWRGAFRTPDEGVTWHPVAKVPSQVSTFLADRARGVLIGTSNGIYRSTDEGLSWTPVAFTGRWVGQMIMTARGEIYAAVDKGTNRPFGTTMMRSVDNGATWTVADEGLSGHSLRGLALDGTGTLFASGVAGVYRRERAGRWQHIGLHRALGTSLFGAPWGDVYATAGSATYRTTDSGARWRPLLLPAGSGLSITVTRDGDLLVGTSDLIYRSSDRGDTWEEAGLGAWVSSLFTVPSTGVIVAGGFDRLFRSTDNGSTWMEPSVGIRSVDVTSFAAGADSAIFAGTVAGEGQGQVYRSTDNGDHWGVLAPDSLKGVVNAIAVLPNGSVVAGTGEGIFRWTPDRSEWEQVLGGTARTRVSCVVVDGAGRVIAGTTTTGVFVSLDGGDTWVPANAGLPTRRIRALAVAADGEIYAATGPHDVEAYDIGRDANAGVRGIFRGRFSATGR